MMEASSSGGITLVDEVVDTPVEIDASTLADLGAE